MITSQIDLSGAFKGFEELKRNIQNNVAIGSARVMANIMKDEIATQATETIGKTTGRVYRKSNLKKSHLKITKRRRTALGWERFKVTYKPPATKDDPKQLRWNVIEHSKEQVRFTKKGKSRGIIQRDEIMLRSLKSAGTRSIRGCVAYIQERLKVNGQKVSAKDIRVIIKSL